MTMQLPLSFYEISELIFLTVALTVLTRLIIYLLKRAWNKQKCKLVWTPIDVVDRRKNLSYHEFIKEYASIGKPVIITDVIQDWKAITKWTLEFFKSECGSIKCAVKEDKDEVEGLMTIADYIDYIKSGNSDRHLYLANWFISDHPQLLEDYEEPIYFPNWLQRLPRKLLKKYELDNPELFIGHKDTSIGLHKDPNNGSAWLGMIKGRKQIVLFTPDQEEFLYSGKVNVFNPNLEKFPLYSKTNSIEIILEAGEILYIPPNWWHHVRNLENTIAVGSLLLNELNSELFFKSITEKDSLKGHLLPLVLEFPWLGKTLFAIGLI